MSKDEYLNELRTYLSKLPNDEQNSAIEDYGDRIEELESNNERFEVRLGSPKDASNEILGEAGLRRMDKPEKGIKSRMDGFWLGILAVFALPINWPVTISIVCAAFAILIVLLAILLVLLVVSFAIIIGVILSFFVSFGVWFAAPMTGLTFTGSGIFLTGLGALAVITVINLWGFAFRLISKMFRNIIIKGRKAMGDLQ